MNDRRPTKMLPRSATTEQRFWAKVEKTSTCWLWRGCLTDKGYGLFRYDGKTRTAHRAVMLIVGRGLTPGLQIDHLCRQRSCVNPAHLEEVTSRENTMRSPIATAAVHVRKTHCPQGHEYDEENTYVYRGWRACRACRAARRAA